MPDTVDVTIRIAPGADRTASSAGWDWTDITSYWHTSNDVSIKHGRSDGATQAESAQLTIWFKGTGGALMPEYALSPYAPGWAEGCPIEVDLDAGGGNVEQFSGFVTAIVPSWPGGSNRQPLVQVSAQGVLAQMEQGNNVLQSPLRRKVLANGNVVGYWALEGGPDITAAESTLPGGTALVPLRSGVAPTYAALDGPVGAGSAPDFTSHGVLVGNVPTYTHNDEWQVEHWFRTDTGESLDYTAAVPLQWDTPGGSVVAWDMLLFVGQGVGGPGLGQITVNIAGYVANPAGGEPGESQRLADPGEFIEATVDSVQGSWHQVRVCAEQASGTEIRLRVYLNDVEIGDETFALFTGAATLGPVTRVTLNPLQGEGAYAGVDGLGLSSVTQVVVYDSVTDPGTYTAGLGHAGETAGDRIARLCDEEGVEVTVEAGDTALMGPQGMDTLPALLRECEAVDLGLLTESGFGLRYLPLRARYNATVALTIDGSNRELGAAYTPRRDTKQARNEWRVSRKGGESATVRNTAHQQLKGKLDDSTTIAAYTDEQLPHAAGWRVNLGTAPGLRVPTVGLNLLPTPQLITAWQACGEGDRLQITNPPAPYTADIDLVVVGWTTRLKGRTVWKVTVNCSPYSPYVVGVYGSTAGTTTARYGARGSYLETAVDADDTALRVHPDVTVWATSAAHAAAFPFDVELNGMRYACSAISGPAFVAAGTAAHADNASVSPGLPAGAAGGDLLLIWAAIRSSGTGTVSSLSGWTSLLQYGNTRLFGKVHSGSESSPSVTFSGGAAGDTTSAQMAAFRRMSTGLSSLGLLGSATQLNSSAGDIATPALVVPTNAAQVLLWLGWKQDDWTSVLPPTGATEIDEPDSTTGSDQGITWAYQILTRPSNADAGSFAVTGGASAISRAVVVSLAGLYEMTVTRLADDRAHAAASAVQVADVARYGM